MPDVLSMLRRVARLEAQRVAPKSPIERAFGSFAAFEDHCRTEIAAEKLDRRDFPLVLVALAKWHKDQVWQDWSRTPHGVWRNQC